MNFPNTLLTQLKEHLSFDENLFLQAHSKSAITSIRLHPIKGKQYNTQDLASVAWCDDAYYLSNRPIFTKDPLMHAGAYYVQEASSMFLQHVLIKLGLNQPNKRILDLCASPGGKSTLIASLLAEDSLLISNEVIKTRVGILEENLTRWGYANTWVSNNDAHVLGHLLGYFDTVVVDAPCSGSGLFRKDKQAISEWSEANVNLCKERQKRILNDVLPALKKEGYLIYSTCSFSKEENEDILDYLVHNYDLNTVKIPIDEHWNILETQSTIHKCWGYRLSPERLSGEGFFIAILQNDKNTATLPTPKVKSKLKFDTSIKDYLTSYLHTELFTFYQNNIQSFGAIYQCHEADYYFLKGKLYFKKIGINVGFQTSKEWVPEHDISVSIHKSSEIQSIDLSTEQALFFLKKENIDLLHDYHLGWHLITYKGLGLGWVKILPNRINNYLPKNLRIRMNLN